MCGIAGAINWGNAESLARMTELQRHRGPDDGGTWETTSSRGDWVGLGSRRLSILDLSPAGHMPMSTRDDRFTMVYNGEVYNCQELRRQLETKGYKFRSDTDTEVVLNLYHHEGPACIRRLNGMFAFAVWDRDDERLLIARDHFGIKPLYYIHKGNQFGFASETKSLLELPSFQRRINPQALDQYLSFLWVPDPLTMFDGVFKLPAGHYAIFQDGRLNVTEYWDYRLPPADHAFERTEEELAEELRERFGAAVQSQMRSDVPLGAFLSAGLDSSGIVASMAQASNAPVRTFTIAFPPDDTSSAFPFDDPAVAKRTADYLGCEHTEIIVKPDAASLLPKLIWHMDEPVADPAIITAYLVNREASQHVKVLLSGVGGDELFAGYRKYVAHFAALRYRRLPSAIRRRMIEPALTALPVMRGSRMQPYVRWAKKWAQSASLPPAERFIMNSIYTTELQKNDLYADSYSRWTGDDPRIRHLNYFDRVGHADFLNQMLYLDIKAFMVSLNLTYNDKMSMANSVEVRVPFLDHELAEWVAWNVPPNLKLHQRTTKHIFRRAVAPLLPDEVLRQKKSGFGAPIDRWISHELREMIDDMLSEQRVRRRGLFKPATVRRWVDEQISGQRDWTINIWQLLTLELWMETFLDSAS